MMLLNESELTYFPSEQKVHLGKVRADIDFLSFLDYKL